MIKRTINITLCVLLLVIVSNSALCDTLLSKGKGYGKEKTIQSYIINKYKINSAKAKTIAENTVKQCEKNGVPVKIAVAIMEVESRFKHSASSGKGDEGLMQVRYKVWKKKYRIKNRKDLHKIDRNIAIGVSILGYYLHRSAGNIEKALSRYSGGKSSKKRLYTKKILKRVREFTLWEKERKLRHS